MEKTQLQLANEQELKQLRLKYKKLKRIVTSDGFSREYYNLLKEGNSPTETFNQLNQFYYDNVEPPTYRYSSYVSFQNYLRSRKK